jgi:cobalt-zinc-cadmium resistance protein CzcA
MLNKIIDGALRNRLMIVLMLLAIVAGAFIMLPKLNLDAFHCYQR